MGEGGGILLVLPQEGLLSCMRPLWPLLVRPGVNTSHPRLSEAERRQHALCEFIRWSLDATEQLPQPPLDQL